MDIMPKLLSLLAPLSAIMGKQSCTWVLASGVALGLLVGTSSTVQAFTGEQEYIKACQAGQLEQCNVLAQIYLQNKDYRNAATHLEKICADTMKENSPLHKQTCSLLLTMLTDEEYGIMDYQKGMIWGDHICAHSNAFGCLLMSNIFFTGKHVNADLNKASEYAKRACALKDGTGCRQAALITFTAAYIQKDVNLAEESYKYHQAACDVGNQASCNDLQHYQQKMEEFKLYAQTPDANAQPQPAQPAAQ